MKVNLITNTESAGLWQDVLILRSLLQSMNPPIDVRVVNNFSPTTDTFATGADLSIFLESLHNGEHYLSCAKSNWLVVNPEWYYPDKFDRHLPLVSLIICKTLHAYEIWSQRVGLDRCLYTGFESRDMLVPGLQKIDGFVHVAGKSEAKGTDTIAEAWRHLPYPLTVVTRSRNAEEVGICRRLVNRFSYAANPIRALHNLSDEELAAELSLHRFSIQPSLQEGFGHVIHEALSARCALLTTNAPSMNESPAVDRRLLIPVSRQAPRMMVRFNYCSADGIRRVVESAVRMRTSDLDDIGDNARVEWERGRDYFRRTFTDAIRCWEEWI